MSLIEQLDATLAAIKAHSRKLAIAAGVGFAAGLLATWLI